MADVFNKKFRSDLMRKIKGKNTKPEIIVRRYLFSKGYRYRIHYKLLPGSPDIVLVRNKIAIFVNGCFWHGHSCAKGRLPKTNTEFWEPKIADNKKRDNRKCRQIKRAGWRTIIVWDCQLNDKKRANTLSALHTRIERYISDQL